jgi:hypothetical protein
VTGLGAGAAAFFLAARAAAILALMSASEGIELFLSV